MLLADIEDTRRAKVARGLKNIDRSVTFIKLPDISATELNRIRGVATGALDSLRKLGAVATDGSAPAVGSGSQGASQGMAAGGSGDAANARLQQALRQRRA